MRKLENCNGYKRLLEAVLSQTMKEGNCFHPGGCKNIFYFNRTNLAMVKCSHKYCDKFAWVIDRVKHYAEHTGLDPAEILDAWESERSYWYMNYYQDCKQPMLYNKDVRVFDTIQDMLDSIDKRAFRCPMCNGITTSPYTCNSGLEMSPGKICDWKSWGLFGPLGKGVYIFVKEKMKIENVFMPIAWESEVANVS